MEEIIDIQKPVEKIYRDKEIWVGTFFGGPLVAGYFIAENFKVFGEYDKAKITWFYTIIATIIIFGGVFLIPENIKIPNQIIPLVYTGIASYLIKHFQGQSIETHINLGGEFFSWWRTIGIGLIGLAIIFITLFAIVLWTDTSTTADTTNTYGVMKHEIAFNKSNIAESEVDKLADKFIRTTFFDEAATKYVYVEKVNNTYEIYISVVKGVENESHVLQQFIDLRTDMQTFYPNEKIIFKLVVDDLDNVVKKLE